MTLQTCGSSRARPGPQQQEAPCVAARGFALCLKDRAYESGCRRDCFNSRILGHIIDPRFTPGSYLVGAGRFELPTSWSQTRRPATGPRPVVLYQGPNPLSPSYEIPPTSRTPKGGQGGFLASLLWYPRRGSNSRLRLRRPALYPLSYGGWHQA